MGNKNTHTSTFHETHPALAKPDAQEGALDGSEPPQLLACLLILPSDAEPIVSMLKNIAASLPCTAPLPFTGGQDHTKAIDDPWLKHAEAAEHLGISKSTLYQYVCQQKIECRKLGGRLEYRRSTLNQFKSQKIRPAHNWLSQGSIIPAALGSGK